MLHLKFPISFSLLCFIHSKLLLCKVWSINWQLDIIWELVKNIGSQASLQTYWTRICILIRSSGNHLHIKNWRSTPTIFHVWQLFTSHFLCIYILFLPPEIPFLLSQNVQILLVTFITKYVFFLVIINWVFSLHFNLLTLLCSKFVNI